jgi:hypothetical protein
MLAEDDHRPLEERLLTVPLTQGQLPRLAWALRSRVQRNLTPSMAGRLFIGAPMRNKGGDVT